MIIPLAQHRPCVFCGRPTAYFTNDGAVGFAHAAPACEAFAAEIERVAVQLHVRSKLLLVEVTKLGGDNGAN